jgi:hypothetical protein
MKMKLRFNSVFVRGTTRVFEQLASAAVAAAWAFALGCAAAACSEAHTDERALSTQGLYSDFNARRVVPEAIEYEPDFTLWSDGVQKRRWLILPESAVIDTSDMEHWQFPVGTKVFKEFGLYGTLLETRLVERVADTGRFEVDYKLATYVWDDVQFDAHETAAGVQNARGTDHNVPEQKQCRLCHRGEPGAVLGISALQLSRSGLLQTLTDRMLLSNGPERRFSIPGDEVVAEAAGYMHANCGHCHSETGQSQSDMRLRLSLTELDGPVEGTALYRTTLGQRITEWKDRPARFQFRVVPGDPERSALYHRMAQRGDEEPAPEQMPPLATERTHPAGLALIKAWIASLTPEAVTRVRQAQADDDAGVPDTEPVSDAGAERAATPGH